MSVNNNSNNKYRNCVGAVIFNENGQVLICRRAIKKKSAVGKYQFPQGGVEAGKSEDYMIAIGREIKEEIGLELSDGLQFISAIEKPLSYEYEFRNSFTKVLGTTFNNIGQLIHWHLFYLPSNKITSIDLNVESKPEFDACQWISFQEFIDNATSSTTSDIQPVPFKLEMYKQLFNESNEIINNHLIK